ARFSAETKRDGQERSRLAASVPCTPQSERRFSRCKLHAVTRAPAKNCRPSFAAVSQRVGRGWHTQVHNGQERRIRTVCNISSFPPEADVGADIVLRAWWQMRTCRERGELRKAGVVAASHETLIHPPQPPLSGSRQFGPFRNIGWQPPRFLPT